MLKPANIGRFFLIVLFLSGCQTYNNFRAYYNTYYNAKKSFRAGLEKIEDQPPRIEFDQFISVYPSPVAAGGEHFEEAINNAAQILRRFSKSKWTDNALLLIGKSYFYRQEYYSALQKFEALLNLQQRGLEVQTTVWKSRVLFETGAYRRGVNFLREQLLKNSATWNITPKARMKVSLAQHLAMTDSLRAAADILLASLPYLENNSLRGRSYFLLGQLYLRLDEFNKAFQAFSNVGKFNPAYEVTYHATLKAARAAALAGNTALAASIYEEMLSDDKNYARRGQLFYQLGQLAEQNGQYEQAERLYKRAATRLASGYSNRLIGDVYFQLAELYSKRFQNYKLAVAYFDSSKATQFAQDIEGDEFRSEGYGRYISLKAQISKIDSLLWLASLNPAALDSVIETVKKRNSKRLRRQLSVNVFDDNTLANANTGVGEETRKSYATTYGFLNYRNEALAARGIRQFRAAWGPRPLADNWRRAEAVSTVRLTNENLNLETEQDEALEKIGRPRADTNLLFDQIPSTPNEKRKKLEQKRLLQYRLANLFFLTLDKPDSAAVYYKKVIRDSGNKGLTAKSLYSLYKLYSLEEKFEKAGYYKSEILSSHAGSIYASRVKGGGNVKLKDQPRELRRNAYQLLSDSMLTNYQQAKKLESLALRNKTSDFASYVYYQAIQEYIKAAKDSSKIVEDSLAVAAPGHFSYSGRYWQKARAMIAKFQKLFPEARKKKQLAVWEKILEREQQTLTCDQINVEPRIAGGMKAFLSKIEWTDRVEKMNISGTLTYEIVIGKNGEVKWLKLLSTPTGLGIEDTYSKAISEHLRFEPIIYKGTAVTVLCTIDFPIAVKK